MEKRKYHRVEEYLSDLPDTASRKLRQVIRAIASAAPGAEAGISYNMPAFRLNGILVYAAAHRDHIGFYPADTSVLDIFARELAPYETSKGTIRFPIKGTMPIALIRRIVKYREQTNLLKSPKGKRSHQYGVRKREKPVRIYFAGSIRGGRDDLKLYQSIIALLRNYGTVLTEHIGLKGVTLQGEQGLGDAAIFQRDIGWLEQCDAVVAEVTQPSHGVGFEVAAAVARNKRILCLYRPEPGRRLSAMIGGCPDVTVKKYGTAEHLREILSAFFTG